MNKHSILVPLFKKIDQVFFGFEDLNEIEDQREGIESNNEEEFDVERSNN